MTEEEFLVFANYLCQNAQAFHASLVEARIAQLLSCLRDFGQAPALRQATKWWQSADWMPDNAVNRTELAEDARKSVSLFHLRYANEVARIGEAVNDNFGTSFSGDEIVRVIQFTIPRHGGAHANRTLAKSFRFGRPGSPRRLICAEPWPDGIEETRPAMDKILKAYQTVIDEAASRGDGRNVRDKHGKFIDWFWEIQHELKPKGGDTEY